MGSYNTFNGISSYAYNVIKNLFETENIWKLVKYDTPDAMSPLKPNLTLQEKAGLIWNGELSEGDVDFEKFRVFQQASTDNVFTKRTTQMRVYVDGLYPDNAILGTTDIKIEILTHSTLNAISDTTKTRLSIMLEEVMKSLNGTSISGVGNLYFNADETRRHNAKYAINNMKNYIGYIIIMSTKTAQIKKDTSCT